MVRSPVTPVNTFYAMSKNAVDPSPDARDWNLRITFGGRTIRAVSYPELLSMADTSEYVTLRCVSNTLQSDLMGTALWTGLRLNRLIDARMIPEGVIEIAAIGVDGHGDSFTPAYLLSNDVLLAVGMNGETLNRTHGFPARLIVPRYYGFKNVKWLGEFALMRKPYLGTWPKMGYTKEPVVHTASHIDRIVRAAGATNVGGVSFAGDRGIAAVEVRADQGPWFRAIIEAPLARFTWTRWQAQLAGGAKVVEARALDGAGRWQEPVEGPLFPDGVKGPTIRRVS
jgi:DMSO/TMAO reductase YedYZ molybdopterin-dependent catalytic subunit